MHWVNTQRIEWSTRHQNWFVIQVRILQTSQAITRDPNLFRFVCFAVVTMQNSPKQFIVCNLLKSMIYRSCMRKLTRRNTHVLGQILKWSKKIQWYVVQCNLLVEFLHVLGTIQDTSPVWEGVKRLLPMVWSHSAASNSTKGKTQYWKHR